MQIKDLWLYLYRTSVVDLHLFDVSNALTYKLIVGRLGHD